MTRSRTRIIIGLGIGGIALLFTAGATGILYSEQSLPTLPSVNDDTAAYRAVWDRYADEHGIEAAYEMFKEYNAQAPADERHFAAHVIGDVIYEHVDLDGVAVCDPSFGYGCFHGFFGVVLAAEGADVISELDDVCVSRFGEGGTGCQHGIGHGILEFVGYNRIDEALRLCDETTQYAPTLGCMSGVFMEYYNPLVARDGVFRNEVRPLDRSDPHGVCNEVDPKYQPSCYFELAAWWNANVTGDYEQMGAWCSDVADPGNRALCTVGIGNAIAVRNNYDAGAAVAHCDDAMPDALDPWCRAGGYWALYANPAHRANAPEMCDGLDTSEQKTCRTFGRLDTLTSDTL